MHEYERRKEDRAEPTSSQFRKDIKALQRGLQKLKLALPATKNRSVQNYLIELGEKYAASRGGHPNLEPHTVSSVIPEWDWMEVTAVDHYRSDERLKQIVDQLIESVTELLDWMNHTPPEMKRNTNGCIEYHVGWKTIQLQWKENRNLASIHIVRDQRCG